jgi:hypothetical protein
MPAKEFDRQVPSLSVVGACVAAEQCDRKVTRDVFSYDFTTCKDAYEKTHTQDERWQNFNNPRLKVFLGYTNESHLHTVQKTSN